MTTIKDNTSKQLLWVGMAGIAMFFAGLTSAFIVRKSESNWLAFEIPEWFWVSTAVIVLSSIFLMIAKKQVQKGNSPFALIFGALILGIVFAYSQVMGWQQLVEGGVYLTGEGSNPSGSFLYVITLAHLVHLIGGLIALIITTIKAKMGKYTAENYLGIELSSIYWHFLDVLWLYLFFFMTYL